MYAFKWANSTFFRQIPNDERATKQNQENELSMFCAFVAVAVVVGAAAAVAAGIAVARSVMAGRNET